MVDTMKAAVFDDFGPPSVLNVRHVPIPTCRPDETLVKVLACGINFHDADIRAGRSRRTLNLPFIGGREIVGVVHAAAASGGPGVGQRVLVPYYVPCGNCKHCLNGKALYCANVQLFGVNRQGGYAEFVAAPARSLIPIPDSVSSTAAAASQIAFSTAYHAIVERAAVTPYETALVTGAAGGVGSAALRILSAIGAKTVALVGTPTKLKAATDSGASSAVVLEGITPEALREIEGTVDVVIDTAGGETLNTCLAMLKQGGRAVVIGAHAGEVVPIDLIDLYRRELSIIGTARANPTTFADLLSKMATGEYQTTSPTEVNIGALSEIHERMESRQLIGKAVLTFDEEKNGRS